MASPGCVFSCVSVALLGISEHNYGNGPAYLEITRLCCSEIAFIARLDFCQLGSQDGNNLLVTHIWFLASVGSGVRFELSLLRKAAVACLNRAEVLLFWFGQARLLLFIPR